MTLNCLFEVTMKRYKQKFDEYDFQKWVAERLMELAGLEGYTFNEAWDDVKQLNAFDLTAFLGEYLTEND